MTKSLNLVKFAKRYGEQDSIQFELGDILVAEFGEAPPPDTRDGTRNSLLAFSDDLAEEYDIHMEVGSLAALRVVATNFPTESRDSVCSWSIHRIAGKPEMLKMIKSKALKLEQRLTVALTGELRKVIEEELKGVTADKITEIIESLSFWLKNWERVKFKLGEVQRTSVNENLVVLQNDISEFFKKPGSNRSHLKAVEN
jgi:hypothetical protein